ATDTASNVHVTASGTYHWLMEYATSPRITTQLGSNRARTGKLATAQVASIDIRPQVQSQIRPGTICLVRLTSSFEGQRATFTINREGDPDHVLTSVELSHGVRPQRTVSLASSHNEGELLHDELEITGHDYLFEQTLQEVADLLSRHQEM
ncbi:MAG: hypothetical protein ACJ788_05300, partial [Ktedonobacteraceae bacterium]